MILLTTMAANILMMMMMASDEDNDDGDNVVCHSTETALLKVVNDLFLSLNEGNISVLTLLDFSSAFDTIDHTILVHRLHTGIRFTDAVIQWFSSYLTDHTFNISI